MNVAFALLMVVLVAVTLGSIGFGTRKYEGFSGSSLIGRNTSDPRTWGMPTLRLRPGQTPNAGTQDVLNRPPQPIPLPEGELLLFKETEFKPECCPNTYSNSMGCACMTMDQYTYLLDRGGNNVPYSEY